MKTRSWPMLALGFALLVLLIATFGYSAMRQARIIHDEIITTNQTYVQTEAFLQSIPRDMYLAGVLLRDYLLEPSGPTTLSQRQRLKEIRASLDERLGLLGQKMGGKSTPRLEQLRTEAEGYWDSLDPIFEWTPQQKRDLSSDFLKRRVLPRQRAVVSLADELTKLNAANLQTEQQQLYATQERFQRFLRTMLALSLSFGIVVALLSTYRYFRLEARELRQREQIERAEQDLRRLSHSLVETQENERKSISRELHDAVGQVLTALSLELGHVESAGPSEQEKFREHLQGAKRLNAETLRLVRDLAMGLRPSMLDDIGLGPALEWQGRQFSRQAGVPVTVQVDGTLEDLPDEYRTCIFRVVQEALTNCSKHAKATNVRVSVYGQQDWVNVTVQDDGVGFDPARPLGTGIGLVGLRERVRELSGSLSIESQVRKGTMLSAKLPVHRSATV
jgi:signal transduction histidine kinase